MFYIFYVKVFLLASNLASSTPFCTEGHINIDVDLPRQRLNVLCEDGTQLLTSVKISSGSGKMREGQYTNSSKENIKYKFCGRTDGSPYQSPSQWQDRKILSVGNGTVKNQKKSSDFGLILKNVVMFDLQRGLYIHAAPSGTEGDLGKPVSAGCVRVSQEDSKKIIDLVRKHKTYGVKVIGQAPTSYKQCEHKKYFPKKEKPETFDEGSFGSWEATIIEN